MKVSIIIPVYNAEKYINDCMESILKELNNDIEILLIDDGSTDYSYELIKSYETENIRVFHHDNHGVSYTRNRGIREAEGEYLVFVDSDDILSDNWKNIILSAINSEDVIYFSNQFNTEDVKKRNILENIFAVKSTTKLGNMSSPCSKLYKRDFIISHNIFFNEKIINGEDALFNLQVILSADSFKCIRKPFYRYRLYGSSSTHKYNERFFNSNIEFLNQTEEILKLYNINLKEIKRYISKSAVYSAYLYIYLISTIKNKKEKQYAIKKLRNDPINKYFNRYLYSSECSFQVNIIYVCVKFHLYCVALLLINIRNKIKNEKLENEKWGDI